jgi:hypothetical protein
VTKREEEVTTISDAQLAVQKLEGSLAQAVTWLLNAIDSNGRPKGAEKGNGWSRLPWTLSLAGEAGAAHAVLEWAVREAIDSSGNFFGPALGDGSFNHYKLAHLANGASLIGRYDVAELVLDQLERTQAPNGGARIEPADSVHADVTAMTSTGQMGITAIIGGRNGMAHRCRDWMIDCLESQPELPHRLYTGRIGDELVLQPIERLAWYLVVDYREARQAYMHSGCAAAFLAQYAMRYNDAKALAAGHKYLSLNLEGTQEQFTDLASVQACKFGWGAAMLQIADPCICYEEQLVSMSDWFLDRQADDGSWRFSTFLSAFDPMVQRLMKTAEHAMEITAMIAALRVRQARRGTEMTSQ